MWTGFKNTPGTMFFAYSQDPGKTPLRGDGCDVQFGSAQRCLMPWWSDPFGAYEEVVVLNPGGPAGSASTAQCFHMHAMLSMLCCLACHPLQPQHMCGTPPPCMLPSGCHHISSQCDVLSVLPLPAMCAVGVEQWGTKWTYSLLNLGGSLSAVLCKQLLVRTVSGRAGWCCCGLQPCTAHLQ